MYWPSEVPTATMQRVSAAMAEAPLSPSAPGPVGRPSGAPRPQTPARIGDGVDSLLELLDAAKEASQEVIRSAPPVLVFRSLSVLD